MSLHPEPIGTIPAQTARIARAAFPKGTLIIQRIEVWAADEHRLSLQPVIRRVWAPVGEQLPPVAMSAKLISRNPYQAFAYALAPSAAEALLRESEELSARITEMQGVGLHCKILNHSLKTMFALG